MLVEISLLLIVICYGLHTWYFNYWKRKGIFQLDGSFIFGNIKDILFLKRTTHTFIWEDIYTKHKQKKLVGMYSFYKPYLVVTDPEILRQILVKDFANFSGPPIKVDKKYDPVFAVNPFAAPDMESWKETRGMHVSLLNPSKLKFIPEIMLKVGHNMINFIRASEHGLVKVKDISELVAIDTVSSYSYGYEPTAFTDPENPFRKYARDFFTKESPLILNGYFLFPKVAKLLQMLSYRTMTKESEEFFISFCKQMLDFRRKNPYDKPDFFEHMLNLNKKRKEEGKKIIPDVEVGINCMTTYLDSFFTTGSSLGFFMVELSLHQDVQEKVRDEIFSIGKKMEDFDYDKVNSLSFLQLALSESLRLHPPVLLSARTCSKSTELAGKKIDAGTRILLPYLAFHMDPKYFPEPEQYKPERYLNEDSHTKGLLLPFGDGPRSCFGQRYAQMVIKVTIIYLLLNFKISPEKKAGENTKTMFPFDAPGDNVRVVFEPLVD